MPVAKRWSDFDLDFTAHPNTGKLSMKYDADAIMRSVRYLLLTNHYERLFHPEIGSNLNAQLFEPMTYATVLRIKSDIVEVIENFEPRTWIQSLSKKPDSIAAKAKNLECTKWVELQPNSLKNSKMLYELLQ